MALNFKKKTSGTKSKAVMGGVKKRSLKKLVFFSLVGVLLLSAGGYAGFYKYKEHSLKAKAAGMQYIGTYSSIAIYGCKTTTPFYGGSKVWKISIIGVKRSGVHANAVSIRLNVYRKLYGRPFYDQIGGKTGTTWYANYSYPPTEMLALPATGDVFSVHGILITAYGTSTQSSGQFSPAYLSDC